MATTNRTRTARIRASVRKWISRHGGQRTVIVSSAAVVGTTFAMYVSYWHIVWVASYGGEAFTSAHLYPVMVDGLMLLSSMLRAADKARNMRPRRWASFTLVAAILMTATCNVLSSLLRGHGLLGMFLGIITAVGVVAGSEMLATRGKSLAAIRKEREAQDAAKAARQAQRQTHRDMQNRVLVTTRPPAW